MRSLIGAALFAGFVQAIRGVMVAFGVLVVMATMAASAWPAGQEAAQPESLSEQDKAFLEKVLKEDFFDPKGAQRVAVMVAVRDVWGGSQIRAREGWLVSGPKENKPRVFFTDGDTITAPAEEEINNVDYVAGCRRHYESDKKAEPISYTRKRVDFQHIEFVEPDLANAAWLHRLGEDKLAAKALALARKAEGDPRKTVRRNLAWNAFDDMVHAYMMRADAEALAHGERLLKQYADVNQGAEPNDQRAVDVDQAKAIVAELRRRQRIGTFGKTPSKDWPKGFEQWDTRRKIAFLIDGLDEIEERQQGQPGGVNLAADRRVKALIALGEAAVPDLIDTVERDKRLTRSVHFFRDFRPSRTVLSVREAALTAAMSILQVRFFETRSTGDSFTNRGAEGAKALAAKMRAYWDEYGRLSFDERMLKVLKDPKTSSEAAQEAARNLAHAGKGWNLGTTVWTDSRKEEPAKPNAGPAKVQDTAIAEAIVMALDRDLQAHAGKMHDMLHDYQRKVLERSYLGSLGNLRDQDAVKKLAKEQARAAPGHMRCMWAIAAFRLGAPEPLRTLADDFRAGRVVLPAKGAVEELGAIIERLSYAQNADADRALLALAEPSHPFNALVKQQVLGKRMLLDEGPWFMHPWCLAVLRRALDDTSPTGTHYAMDKNDLRYAEDGRIRTGQLPEFLKDAKDRRQEADERLCDLAAMRLNDLVLGLPPYHPLYQDADKRLAEFKATFDRYAAGYQRSDPDYVAMFFAAPGRPVSSREPLRPVYIPGIRPLARAATAEDVAAHKAIFHREGKGKPVGGLPIVARWGSEPVLIVQAETAPTGEIVCGVVGRYFIKEVPDKKLDNGRPVPALLWSDDDDRRR